MELLPMLLLFGLLGLMMYFMSRRQRRTAQQQQELQSSLTVGDRVMTTSGLHGTITDISEDATIEIEIAPGVETTWLRAAVREKIGPDNDLDDDLEDSYDEDESTVEDTDVEPSADATAEVAPSLEHDKQKR